MSGDDLAGQINHYGLDDEPDFIDLRFLDDGISGKKVPIGRRPQGQLLLEAAERRQFDAIVVSKIDRFARISSDFGLTWDQLPAWDVKLLFVAEQLEDTSAGRFMGNAFSGMAEFEAERIAERMRSGKLQGAKNNPLLGGFAPYGYRVTESKDLELEPSDAEVVRQVLDLYVNAGWNLRQILSTEGGLRS